MMGCGHGLAGSRKTAIIGSTWCGLRRAEHHDWRTSWSSACGNSQFHFHHGLLTRRHLYAVLPCNRDDSLELRHLRRRGPDRRVCRTLAGFLDEPLHPRRRLHHQSSRRSTPAGAMGVNHALWKMNERSGAGGKRLAGQREVEGTLEDVKALVAVVMNMRRRTELGSSRELGNSERAVGVVADNLERVQIGQQPERLPFASAEVNAAMRQ